MFGVVLLMRILIALMVCAALLPGVSAGAQEPRPLPGEGIAMRHAQVIAHGVASLPAREIAWRLSRREALVPSRAVLEKRSGRFVLADDGVIAVVDEAGAIRTRLSPGEAVWTEPGERLAVVSLDGNRAAYYEIALAPAAAQSAASDMAATTASFPAPDAAAVDVDLIRDVLERNEESAIPAGLTAMLLAVSSGKVFVETGNGEIAEIAAGEFVQIAGDVVVVGASRAPAAFVVARVGSPVPERVILKDASPTAATPATLPTPAATPVGSPDGPASVTIAAHVCPAGYAGSDYAVDCAEPAGGIAFSIEAEGEAVVSELTAADGAIAFAGVAPGDYVLLAGLPGAEAASRVSCRNIRGDEFRRAAERHQTVLSLGRKDHVSCDWYIVPADAGAAMRSFLSVSLRACPEGMTPQRFDRAACEAAPPGIRLTLRDEASGTLLKVAAMSPDAWAWEQLGARPYHLDVAALPSRLTDSALDRQPCCGEEHDFTVSVPTGFSRVERTLFLFLPDVPRDLGVTVLVRACPPGMTAETLIAELCLPAPPGATLSLLERGAPVGVTTAAADAWIWNGLGPLEYGLQINAIPAGFTTYQLDDVACCATDADFALALSEGDAAAQRTLYLLQPPGADDAEIDSDGDGLVDAREVELETNPFLPDADDDRLGDGDEVNFYGTDPKERDTDDDGLDDTEEVQTYNTNPLLADTDGDGVSDRREVTAGSDPLDTASIPTTPTAIPTPTAVPTETPIPTATSFATATPVFTATPAPVSTPALTPAVATPEGEPASLPTVAPLAEAVATLPPVRASPGPGSRETPEEALDGDGLPTLDEIAIHGTSPTTADTDGDGIDDGDEVAAGTDPRVPGEG